MLHTNLLPPIEKKAVYHTETTRIVIFFGTLLAVSFGIVAVLLIPSLLPVLAEEKELKRLLRLEDKLSMENKSKEIIAKVKGLEEKLVLLKSSFNETSRASSLLEGLLQNAGSGIVLEEIGIKKSGAVLLGGIARTRRELLDFEKALRDSGKFQELISSLPKFIVRESDIRFTIQGKLKTLYSL